MHSSPMLTDHDVATGLHSNKFFLLLKHGKWQVVICIFRNGRFSMCEVHLFLQETLFLNICKKHKAQSKKDTTTAGACKANLNAYVPSFQLSDLSEPKGTKQKNTTTVLSVRPSDSS